MKKQFFYTYPGAIIEHSAGRSPGVAILSLQRAPVDHRISPSFDELWTGDECWKSSFWSPLNPLNALSQLPSLDAASHRFGIPSLGLIVIIYRSLLSAHRHPDQPTTSGHYNHKARASCTSSAPRRRNHVLLLRQKEQAASKSSTASYSRCPYLGRIEVRFGAAAAVQRCNQ